MTPARLIMALFATAFVAAAGSVRAEQAPAPLMLVAGSFTFPPISSNSNTPAIAPRRSLEWDARKGRWGVKLGVEQHTDRDMQWKDLEPGVFYRLTPRLHIGGGVSLAPDGVDNQRLIQPQMPAPRVRLETTFKF